MVACAGDFNTIDRAHVIHQRIFGRPLMLGTFLPFQLPRLNSELHINPTYRALDVLGTRHALPSTRTLTSHCLYILEAVSIHPIYMTKYAPLHTGIKLAR